jgi:4'-phosphopantetheinyl transferase EntD
MIKISAKDLAAIIEEELVEKLGIDNEETLEEISESIIDRAEDESLENEGSEYNPYD